MINCITIINIDTPTIGQHAGLAASNKYKCTYQVEFCPQCAKLVNFQMLSRLCAKLAIDLSTMSNVKSSWSMSNFLNFVI